jgi:histidyl-tRNA synthetase
VPAIGFSYNLERVIAAVPTRAPAATALAVLVRPATSASGAAFRDDEYAYGLEVARRLRAAGFTALLDLARTGDDSQPAATSDLPAGVGYLALVAAADRSAGTIGWHDLATGSERRLHLDELDNLDNLSDLAGL